ncbi:hypothetical protein [Streptomyces sp. NPDC008125]|uniref:hypothetical protein n=1 Tax=Streptomyces sp. NPDC008125 TaxID=3364811 RepID=UPI0036E7E325
MSIDRSDDEAPARRRPSAMIGAVVAAVVLAGGGGAWWAATADDGGEGAKKTASSASASPAPAPLGISGPADPSVPGFAPGEPAPTGVVYRATGDLPQGPATAPVHRTTAATVSLAEAARAARAFGMQGTPTAQEGYWRLGAGGSKPYLEVSQEAPGTWKYLRGTGGLSPCPSGAVCAGGTSGGNPVSREAAREAARPVLDALGLGDAALGDGGPLGAQRVVRADPVVDGLPTHGWSTDVQVGPDSAVTGASGRLLLPTAGNGDALYPVVDAAAALASLNAAQGSTAAPACATAEPLESGEGGAKTAGPECVPSSGRIAPPTAMAVEKAVFGLSAQLVDERPALVPSWLFTVRPEAGGPVSTVGQVAVAPAYLETPSASRPSRGVTPISYTEHGRTLEVSFWGGVCGTYTASAEEDRTEVRVTITEPRPKPGTACVALAERVTVQVPLDAPLGGRTVRETASGKPVPRA